MGDHLERIGQTVSDYRLVRWLGGGGFGNVYLAEHTHDGEQVALKVLEIRLTKSQDLRAFLNEARMMRLHHLHIVPLLDFGLSREDTPFLVMEYAPEGTLRDRHPKGSRVPLPIVVEYAIQVASALSYAHNRRVVHRDVKPENMLVRADEVILLSDFGIATTAHSTHSLSANQGIGGTIPYMAPEQLEGQPRTESDQYALGIVIYEWLAGRCPFQGTAVEVAMQHALKQPPSLVKQVPGLPQEVEEVLFQALAKNHNDRFASMQAFLRALQDASDYSPTLHELSDEPFPKEVSPVVPPPVANPSTVLPSSGVLEPHVFSPSREELFTWTVEAEPATKERRTLPVTGSVQEALHPFPLRLDAPATVKPSALRRFALLWLAGLVIVALASGIAWFAVYHTASTGSVHRTSTEDTHTAPTATSIIHHPTSIITEFSIPTPNSQPDRIIVGPDGNLWFTEYKGNQIGRISTAGSISEFPIPTPSSKPYDITVGPDRTLWFTGNYHQIDRISTAGSISEFHLSNTYADEIIAGPDGALWFTEYIDNRIGRISTAGSVSEFPIPTAHSSPEKLIAGPDGALWFTEWDGNKIGRISTTGSISEFPIPTAHSGPSDITVGPDRNLWFTEDGGSGIGRISTTGSISEFRLTNPESGADQIVVGPDDNLWFTESGDQIGRISTAGSISEFPIPTARSGVTGIVVGPDGALWFTESGRNQIGRISTAGSISEFPIPTPSSKPYYIIVGPDGALWFNEGDGNKIGHITFGK